jgi:aryl-alcohol dehydrogenase-like predicted oxidoreductase
MQTPLPTAPLGKTGMEITRVGLGAWAIGGGGWFGSLGPQDDESSRLAIRHAVDAGVNWVDTAAIYGLGHSEEVVGRALKGFSADDRPYVFTKCGLVLDHANRMKRARRVGNAAELRQGTEDSLRRLGVEQIDLMQLHWPAEDGTSIEDYWATLLALKAEGKVAAVGLSNHSADQLEVAEKVGHVDTLQPPFSLIKRDVAAAELSWCATHDTGVIVYSPMQAGLLSGGFSRERVASLPADDWRSRAPDFTEPNLTANLALADALAPVAERHGVSRAAVAVSWTLAWTGVTGAIVGARRPDQVDGWLAAAQTTLTEADLDEIAAAVERTGAGHGPSRPAPTT